MKSGYSIKRSICFCGFAFLILASAIISPVFSQCEFDWKPGQSLPGVNGTVYAVTTWDPDANGPQSELLVVGGCFTVAGNVLANNIAAWDGNSWQAIGSGMNNGGVPNNGMIKALAVYNGELIAAGTFNEAGGVPANNIARWNGANWQPLGSGLATTPSGLVRAEALAVYNGELITGGSFNTAGGVSASRVARWNGSIWQSLGSGMNSTVYALAVYDNKLIAGGAFTSAGGVSAGKIACWNAGTWQSLGTGISGSFSCVYALTADDDQLIAAGNFTTAGESYCLLEWH